MPSQLPFAVGKTQTARGRAAAYFPETNAVAPLDSVAEKPNAPVLTAVVVRLEPHRRA